MTRTVVIHQPDFLPYLGFFHRFLHADVYVVLDHVQFSRRGWTHRDQVKSRNGPAWLSLSVKKCAIDTPIGDVELSPHPSWREDNLNMIDENYRGTPYFDLIFGRLEQVYNLPLQEMMALNLSFLDLLCEWLGIRIERVHSSMLEPAGTKSEMIAGLVAAAQGTHYLSGLGAKDYHEQLPFERRGIDVVWQDFKHPNYTQQFGAFVPYLSTIDALFNLGPEATAQMLRNI